MASTACIVTANTCTLNGVNSTSGRGIRVLNTDTRVEGNNCTGNDVGISADLGGNFIVGNACSGNGTDWIFVVGNSFGPILDRRNQGGAAVNGFSAPTNLNTTDPHANFSY